MTGWKKFATLGSFPAAREKIRYEESHGARGYEFKYTKEHVGRSVDPAYSDKDGNQWIVWYRVRK